MYLTRRRYASLAQNPRHLDERWSIDYWWCNNALKTASTIGLDDPMRISVRFTESGDSTAYLEQGSNERPVWHIEAETKWTTFSRQHFPMYFFNENIWISNTVWRNVVRKDFIDNNTALVQIMAWHRSGDKPYSWTNGGLVYWGIYASLGLNGLMHGKKHFWIFRITERIKRCVSVDLSKFQSVGDGVSSWIHYNCVFVLIWLESNQPSY